MSQLLELQDIIDEMMAKLNESDVAVTIVSDANVSPHLPPEGVHADPHAILTASIDPNESHQGRLMGVQFNKVGFKLLHKQ